MLVRQVLWYAPKFSSELNGFISPRNQYLVFITELQWTFTPADLQIKPFLVFILAPGYRFDVGRKKYKSHHLNKTKYPITSNSIHSAFVSSSSSSAACYLFLQMCSQLFEAPTLLILTYTSFMSLVNCDSSVCLLKATHEGQLHIMWELQRKRRET